MTFYTDRTDSERAARGLREYCGRLEDDRIAERDLRASERRWAQSIINGLLDQLRFDRIAGTGLDLAQYNEVISRLQRARDYLLDEGPTWEAIRLLRARGQELMDSWTVSGNQADELGATLAHRAADHLVMIMAYTE